MITAMQRFVGRMVVNADELDAYFNETRGLERNFLREVLRSRQNAWITAGLSGLLALVSLLILLVHVGEASRPMPPFILRVDNATGQTDVVSVMKERQTSYSELIDQYWVSQYVLHRESYDYETIQADYNATGLMSTSGVASQYHEMFSGDKARDKTLLDKARIVVAMESAPVIDTGTGTAVARFTTTLSWRNGQPDEVKHWIATLAYRYSASPMKPQDRLTNPLGFQVTSYRLNPELGHGS